MVVYQRDCEVDEESDDEAMKEIHEQATKIRTKKKLMKNENFLNNTKKPTLPRTAEPKKRERSVSRLKKEFTELGVDMSGTDDAHFATTRSRSGSRPAVKKARMDRSESRATPRDQSGVRDPEMKTKLKKMEKKTQNKKFNKMGKSGEADRHIAVKKPKHLFAGKRGIGKADRR